MRQLYHRRKCISKPTLMTYTPTYIMTNEICPLHNSYCPLKSQHHQIAQWEFSWSSEILKLIKNTIFNNIVAKPMLCFNGTPAIYITQQLDTANWLSSVRSNMERSKVYLIQVWPLTYFSWDLPCSPPSLFSSPEGGHPVGGSEALTVRKPLDRRTLSLSITKQKAAQLDWDGRHK